MSAKQRSATGGCQCGAVTFRIDGEPLLVARCHCLNCQKSSGAGHVPFAAFAESAVTIMGLCKAYSYTADSGGVTTTHFCPECGSTIFDMTTSMPEMISIRLGNIDESSSFEPQMDVYMKRRRTWDHDLQDKPAFDALPPMR